MWPDRMGSTVCAHGAFSVSRKNSKSNYCEEINTHLHFCRKKHRKDRPKASGAGYLPLLAGNGVPRFQRVTRFLKNTFFEQFSVLEPC